MNNVLIITIPAQDTTRPPGALAILAACCEQANSNYEIFDVNLYIHKNLPFETVNKLNTDFEIHKFRDETLAQSYREVCNLVVKNAIANKFTHIAISVFTYASILAAYELLLAFKQENYQGQIIIGGMGVTNSVSTITGKEDFGTFALNKKLITHVIYGEGDIAFTELLKGNYSYPGINQNNNIQILDLDQLPKPSYEKINPREYFYSDEPEVLLTGSRGCVRSCTFCNVAEYWNRYVYKSGTRIAQELFDIWQKTGINKFDFSDSLINGSMSSFKEFNKELIRLRKENPGFTPKYKGQFICRPSNHMSEQDYSDMSSAGAETLVVGIESFSESVRDHMRKKFNNDSIEWHFAMCAKYGVKNALLLISGYVTETIEDHNITIEYLKRFQVYALSRTIYAINIVVGGLALSPGTPLTNEDMGINISQYVDGDFDEYNFSNWINSDNLSLTPNERLRRSLEIIKTAYQLGYKVLHLYHKIDTAERHFNNIKNVKKLVKINTIELQ